MPSLIRSGTLAARPRYCFADLQAQGQQILDAARRQAQTIIDAARATAEQEARAIRAAALEAGRREGFEQARRDAAQSALNDARREIDQLCQTLRNALDAFERDKRALLAAAEAGLIQLALAIAQRVCKLQAARGPQVAAANVVRLLELCRHEHDLSIHLHPDDLEALRHAGGSELLADIENLQHVRLTPDPALERGDCRLESTHGTIDASLDVQLRRVAAALTGTDPDARPPAGAETQHEHQS